MVAGLLHQVKAVDWALKAEELGAGEILLTSMNTDGTKSGFSIDITREVSRKSEYPGYCIRRSRINGTFQGGFRKNSLQCCSGCKHFSFRGDYRYLI